MKELVYRRLFLRAAEQYAADVAYIEGEKSSTFGSHAMRVFQLGDALGRELGCKPDTRIAVLGLNSRAFVELVHAGTLGAGLVNPLNVRLGAAELRHVLADSGSEIAFVDPMFAAAFNAAVDGAGLPLRHVVQLGAEYESLVAIGSAVVPDEPDEDDPAVLVYTGGTTGPPKGVVTTQRANALNVYRTKLVDGLGTTRGRTYLQHVPMFHTTGLIGVMCSFAFGVRSVLLPAFDAERGMDVIERHRIEEAVMVPTMIAMVLNHPSFAPQRLSSLRKLGYGGSPMSVPLLNRLLSLYPDLELVQGYGMTESSGAVTLLTAEDHRHGELSLLASVGRAVPGVELRIEDPATGTEVPRGEIGELCIRSGSMMSEYWGQPETTARAFRGGWYHTGDVGRLTEDGYLYLVDRVEDMIITGGENVSSLEVENALAAHPAVAQVAVIGVPDEVWGERVHAVVVFREGQAASVPDLQEHVRGVLARYKVPKTIDISAEPLPISAAMKPLKHELRKRYSE